MKGDYQTVLNALGSRVDDIPIADGSDHICAVLRANALERMGRANEALEQLTRMMLAPGGAELVGAIIQANGDLQLCPHTFPQAQQQQQQTATNVVKTASGFAIGPIFLIAFGGPLLGVGGGALLDALGVAPNEIFMGIAITLYVVLLLATIFWTLSKGARVRAHLQKAGVRGSATVLSANETGTRVNNQPVIALLLQVEAQGMQPFRAEHHQIIGYAAIQRVVPGSRLQVMVDPSDPRQMAIDFE
jgi:hypothetical protein